MTISFSGLASGLDTSSWVESLVALKRAKVTSLEEEKSSVQLTKDALNSIKSFFNSFRSVLEKVTESPRMGLVDSDIFAKNLAISSKTNLLTATATEQAKEGTYNIVVDKLASGTEVKSNYSYMTTIVQTTTATENSKLTDLGVNISASGSRIGVMVNGVERGINLTKSDTIATFIDKLNEIGVEASYNNATGIFSANIGKSDVKDTSGTGIADALHLEDVNEGYASNTLQTSRTETVYSVATGETKLTELGVLAGDDKNVTFRANGEDYVFNVQSNTTINDLLSFLNSKNIDCSFDAVTGLFSMSDVEITSDSANFVPVFGVNIDTYSKSQKTGALSYTTLVTHTTEATSDTKLSELGEGYTITNGTSNVLVKNSNDELITIALSENMTVGDLLSSFENAGLFAQINSNGEIEIAGGQIVGGTFNAIEALGLTSEPYTAMVTGNALQETVTIANAVDFTTRFVEDMGVTRGYLEVTKPDGEIYYEKIYSGMTIADFIADMGNIGINADLNLETGVLELTGGSFRTMTDEEVRNADIVPPPSEEYAQGTNLLTCLFGSDEIEPNHIHTSSVRARSKALTSSVTNLVSATLATELSNLGLEEGTAQFEVRGETRSITLEDGDTIQSLMTKLSEVGIASSFDSDTSRLKIENAVLTGGTSNLSDVLNLTTTVDGKYKSSNNLYVNETVTVDATRDTKLGDYGITGSLSASERIVSLYSSDGDLIATLSVSSTTSIGELVDFINNNGASEGTTASIIDGVLTIDNGYIENAAIQTAMGLSEANKSSYVLGSVITVTTTGQATADSKLSDIIHNLHTDDAVAGGYNLNFNSTAIAVDGNTTLNELIGKIYAAGGTASLDSSGRLSIDGGVITGTVAQALGITSVTNTASVSATGATLYTDATVAADLNTTLRDVGVNGTTNFVVCDAMGVELKTVDVANTTTLGEFINLLRNEGIDATMSEGIISLSSNDGKYITGTLPTALGIDTSSSSDTINTSMYSTVSVTYTGTVTATTSSTLGEIGAITSDGQKIIIKDENRTAVGTISNLTTTSTVADMFEELRKEGISGVLVDGVISLYSATGKYAEGEIITNLGISTVSGAGQTITIGKTATSTAQISYTANVTATEGDKISDFVTLPSNKVITVYNSVGGESGTVTVNNDTTFGGLLEDLANYGIYGTIENGIISLESLDNSYASGDVLNVLGITLNATTVTTISGGTVTSTAQITYTDTIKATEDSKISDFITLPDNKEITMFSDGGTPVGTVTVNSTTTFGNLFREFAANGIEASLHDGVISMYSNTGAYATGQILTDLGITSSSTTVTTTVGTSLSSTAVVNYTSTVTASESDLISSYIALPSDKKITVYSDGGDVKGTVTVSGTTTFGGMLAALGSLGVEGTMHDGVISLFSNDGSYAIGDTLAALNIGYHTVTTSVTATENDKISDFITLPGNKEITMYSGSGAVTGTVTIDSTTTFGSLFRELASHDIEANIHDGVISLDSNSGAYATGDVLNTLGIGTQTLSVTTTVGTTLSSTVAVTYTQDVVATVQDKISDFTTLTGDATINIVDNAGNSTICTVSSNSTFGQLFSTLMSNGIQADMTNGVITLYSPEGKYVTGQIAEALNISTSSTTTTVTVTSASDLTSTAAITYTESRFINENDTLKNVTGVNYTTSNGKITIKNGTTSVGTITVIGSETLDTLFTKLAAYTITGSVTDGVVSLTSGENITAQGAAITGLGIGLTSVTTTTTTGVQNSSTAAVAYTVTAGVQMTSTAALTKTETVFAGLTSTIQQSLTKTAYSSSTITDFGLRVKNAAGTIQGTVTVSATGTFDSINTALASYGITVASNGDGTFTFSSDNGNYVQDANYKCANGTTYTTSLSTYGLLGQMGVTMAVTSTTVTTEASSTTRLSQISGIDVSTASNRIIEIRDNNDNVLTTKTFASTATLSSLITYLNGQGIASELTNGKIYIDNTGEKYITGGLTEQLGIQSITSSVTQTVGMTIDGDLNIGEMSMPISELHSVFLQDIDRIESGMAEFSTVSITSTLTSGTYGISSAEDMVKLSTMVNNNKIGVDCVFVMTKDIDMAGVNWTPIGNAYNNVGSVIDKYFSATFDGNGHVIKNLNCNNTQRAGLFGRVVNGVIKNLGLVDCDINATKADNGTDFALAGGIAAEISKNSQTKYGSKDPIIENCFVSGTIHSEVNAGGIASCMTGGGSINYCYSLAEVVSDEGCAGALSSGSSASLKGTGNYAYSPSISGIEAYYQQNSGSSSESVQAITTTGDHAIFDVSNTKLGTNQNFSIKINNNGVETHVTGIGGTINDIADRLSIYGISASIINGKMHIEQQPNCYITDMDYSLQMALGIEVGDSKSYSTVVSQIRSNSNSADLNVLKTTYSASGTSTNSLTYNTTSTAVTSATKFVELGLNLPSLISGVAQDGSAFSVIVQRTDTLDDLFTQLAGYGISGSIVNGTVTLTPTEGSYIEMMGPPLSNIQSVLRMEGISFYSTLPVNATSATKFGELGLGPLTGTVSGKHDGVGYTVSVTASDTIDDLFTRLAAYGISGSITNGTVTLTPTEGSYITSVTNLRLLNLGDTFNTTTSNTVYSNTPSGVRTIDGEAHLMNTNSTIGELVSSQNNGFIGSVTTVSTAGATALTDALITSGTATGTTYVISSTQDFIIFMDIANAGKINNRSAFVLANDIDCSGYDFTGIRTFASRLYGNGHSLKNFESQYLFTRNDGMIQDLAIENGYIGAMVNENNGRIQNCYTTGEWEGSNRGSIAITNNCEIVESYGNCTHVGTTIYPDNTVSSLNFANCEYPWAIMLTSNGESHTLTFNTTNSVDDIISSLAGYGISGSVSNDGKLTLDCNDNSYITNMGSGMKAIFKMNAGSGVSYNTVQQTTTVTTNTSSDSLINDDVEKTITTSTTFADLGYNVEPWIKVKYQGQSYNLTFNVDSTMDDLFTTLAGFGISGHIQDGIVTLSGSDEGYINGWVTGEHVMFKFPTPPAPYTTQVQTTISNTDSNRYAYDDVEVTNTDSTQQRKGFTQSLVTSSTMSELGLADNGTMTVNYKGFDYTVTVKTADTVDDLLTTLAGLGISGYAAGGKLYLDGTQDGYIKNMSDSVKNIFKFDSNSAYDNSAVHNWYVNSNSDEQSKDVITTLNTSTTLSRLGMVGNGVVTIKSGGTDYSVTISDSSTVDDLISTLAGFGVAGSVNDGRLSLISTNTGVITSMTSNLQNALKLQIGEGQSYTSTTQTYYESKDSNKQTRNATQDLNENTTFGYLGMNTAGQITVVTSGTERVINVNQNTKMSNLITALAGYGISASIDDGKITLTPNGGSYVKDMSSNVKSALKLNAGENYTWESSSSNTWVNTDSRDLEIVRNDLKISGDTKLSSIDGWNNGNGKLVVHKTDGTFDTITVDQSKTVDDFFNQIAGYGLAGTVDSEGRVTITGTGNVYLQSATGGSNILTALKLTNLQYNVQTVTVNRTSDALTHTVQRAATGATTLEELKHGDGVGIHFSGNNVSLVVSTTSDSGNNTATVTFNKTSSLHDVIDRLAQMGINASVDSAGRFSINSSTLNDFDVSGELGTFLMESYTKAYNTDTTYNISTNLIQTTVETLNDSMRLDELGITNGNILVNQQGVNYTVMVNNSVETIGDFRNLLSQYGFTTNIDNQGRMSVTGIGNSTLSTIAGQSNIIDVLGIGDWSLGEITQTSAGLTDNTVNVVTTSWDTKLSQLTDENGNSLGITSGGIYVYKDGTRSSLNVSSEDTLSTLASKLSTFGISMNLDSNGKVSLYGSGDSYLVTTEGIASPSNVLSQLGLTGDWTTDYDSTSGNLTYEEQENVNSIRNTRLLDLQDSNGDNLGITEGTYYVYQNGVRSTETITDETTVNDLMSVMASHGLVADIAEDGSISVNGYNNTYMAPSLKATGNSNLLSALFESSWDFTNIYSSNGLTFDTTEDRAITRNTQLKNINTDDPNDAYQAGNITVIKDGVQTNISLTAEDTVGTLMDELALYGFESVINDDGQLIIRNTGDSKLQDYTGSDDKSNALQLLGIELTDWITTNTYEGKPLDSVSSGNETFAATRETELSKLGVTTGEYYIYNNGVKYTSYISSDETVGSLMDTLRSFGIESSLVQNGDSSVLSITGHGDSYVASSNNNSAKSNVVETLFSTPVVETKQYSNTHKTSATETIWDNATEDTKVSDLQTQWGESMAGTLSVTMNGVDSVININENDTLGDVLDKFRAIGVEATLANGSIMIQDGYDEFTINTAGSSSSLANSSAQTGLTHTALSGYTSSSELIEATTSTIEDKTVSVAMYADLDTELSKLNISSGSVTMYADGKKATLNIQDGYKFSNLSSQIAAAYGGDVTLGFDNGYLTITSASGKTISFGSTTDTSNFCSITGMQADEAGVVKSARELYKVNLDSKVTDTGLFRRGDITEGSFVIGTATLTVDDTTTISDLISMINNNGETQATAYWDNIKGELVIQSRINGASFVNIEAVDSNLTHVLGFTTQEGGQSVMNVNTQKLGSNAKFSINGTTYTASDNVVGEDVTRLTGVTINLLGASEGETIELKVQKDSESVATAVEDVVNAYNELMANVDEAIAKEGALHKESTLKLIRDQLRNLMTRSYSSTDPKNIFAIGITTSAASGANISTSNKDVISLTFDKTAFMDAYNKNHDAVKNLLVGNANEYGGIFGQLEKKVEETLSGAGAFFEVSEKSYTEKIQNLNKKILKETQAVTRYQQRLEAKFKAMDMLIAQMNQQYSSFLTS